ncbi:hypothetical protein [Streptomyces sp. bgisy153]|uniref:hypothetical protein n=1 Tax=Streptomyces sp. bgisy153 TaxID=3413793 RepID=UPI003D7370B3
MKIREDVARMLRDGATIRQIMAELGVSNHTVIAARRALNIPLPPGRARRTPAETAALEEQAVRMLREGATGEHVRKALHLSPNRISALRKEHNIPVLRRDVWAGQRRTINEAFTRYAQPTTDGDHLIWTGPRCGRGFDLIASGRKYNARAIAFEKHHGRPPVGYLRRTCKLPDCIAGAHHTDHRLRNPEHHLDTLYTAIFGPETPQ